MIMINRMQNRPPTFKNWMKILMGVTPPSAKPNIQVCSIINIPPPPVCLVVLNPVRPPLPCLVVLTAVRPGLTPSPSL